jgi:hypothetical protein
LPPCPPARIAEMESELGKLPAELHEMLRFFNGAELFIKAIPMVTIFGLSPLSEREWPVDWYIDAFTRKWRTTANHREDWVFGIMNYGGLLISGSSGVTKQWDTASHRWEIGEMSIQDRFDGIVSEGLQYLATD